jgi:hypothetical protein
LAADFGKAPPLGAAAGFAEQVSKGFKLRGRVGCQSRRRRVVGTGHFNPLRPALDKIEQRAPGLVFRQRRPA